MRYRTTVVVLALSSSATAGACGLDALGTGASVGSEGANGTDASTTPPRADSGTPIIDGSDGLDAPTAPDANVPDASACAAAGNACSAALAPGWTPVAFTANRSSTCPGGYTVVDLVASPTTNAGACACGCQIAANDPPTCASGSFVSVVGASTCSGTGQTFTVNGTGCTVLAVAGGVSAFGDYAAFALDRGTCVSSTMTDATKLGSTGVRACVPPPACVEDVCVGTASALGPYGACIVHDGDVACPAGPFTSKTSAGATATLSCGGCATCQNDATCGTATVRFYADGACATQVASRIANDACNPLATGSAGTNATHYRYDVATNSPTCAPTGAPTVATSLEQPRTICCR
jgi:hypothetical protein